ncbi:phage replisome organizer N-terminal domain-containing protein [Jeotgalibacillus haloalkalitolerans]|uniref:Phage replisome organizer N-terminal domain-containing protein n=1 Tax=Jeotgalibacillus haloalkalitolerans TaxID=3104292 RepID=A0ABU5KM74_9BACL|nr:phage replisome organizer N-terminal domain-containing protein [Jeotgalibacillus sp. HH7-29]MDZ5712270.1 phage replisome organizer N-terminal domain-containing protein [Jeotgalibacillus sp. HH7-29]
MSEVKWIKLSTQMFEDEKIRLIESMPEADTILIIWVKLLAQAGKTNASGYIYLSENIPYTDEMLSTIFNRPLNTVRLALQTFKNFGMIEIEQDNFVRVANWEKHQNTSSLEKIRKDTRERVAKHRENKRIQKENSNVTCNGEVTDIELEEELEEEKEKEYIPFFEIIEYLNKIAGTKFRASSKKTKDLIKARWNEQYTLDDFKSVINKKTAEWKGNPEMEQYLRPITLFSPKFESYLNQPEVKKREPAKAQGPGEFGEDWQEAIERRKNSAGKF